MMRNRMVFTLPKYGTTRCAALLLVVGLLTMSGCGYPAAQPANLGLITSLRTALSAKNPAWLDANEEKIEERRAAGQMNDDEYAAFQAIIADARRGDWESAERAAVKFQRAQRPSDEQVQRAREREERQQVE